MNSIEKKIAFSFGIVSLAFLAMTIITLTQVSYLTALSRRIQYVLEPSIEANLRATIAINASITSLQSRIITNEDRFMRQRKAFWSVIEKNYEQLNNLSDRWEHQDYIDLLRETQKDLLLFKEKQKDIENIANTERRDQALNMLQYDVIPLGQRITSQLRQISDPQKWEMQRVFTEEEEQERILRNTALLFLLLSIIGGTSMAILLIRAVIFPLQHTIKLARTIAEGDYLLDAHFSSGERKLDNALKKMANQLYEKDKINKRYNHELEEANEELSQFAYRTSHDLKGPLITIRRLANIIEEDITDGDYIEAKQNVRSISLYVKKLEELVVDILNLTKADLEVSEKEGVDILQVVSEVKERLGMIYVNNDVEIKTDIDNSFTFYASKIRITQIIENLVSNAIKYSDTEKPSSFVKISTSKQSDKIICKVEDNGIGIPEEFAGRVFGMFQRFHPKYSYGSGLGMYIIKKHIDKMNGKIHFHSSEDGTLFTMEFPAHNKEVV